MSDWISLATFALALVAYFIRPELALRQLGAHLKPIAAVILCVAIGVQLWSRRDMLIAFASTGHLLPGWVLSVHAVAWVVLIYGWLRHELRLRDHAKDRRLPVSALPSNAVDLDMWDYSGQWSIDSGAPVIGQSDRGGILPWGTQWEDCVLTFRCCISLRNMGVIVRARDRENYDMLQITPEFVRLHRRRTTPIGVEWDTDFRPVRHGCDVRRPFTCSVIAQGSHVQMLLNGVPVLDDKSFLRSPRGSVGFRCAGDPSNPERAQVWDIAVQIYM